MTEVFLLRRDAYALNVVCLDSEWSPKMCDSDSWHEISHQEGGNRITRLIVCSLDHERKTPSGLGCRRITRYGESGIGSASAQAVGDSGQDQEW